MPRPHDPALPPCRRAPAAALAIALAVAGCGGSRAPALHALGGTVAGLGAATLVLANEGDTRVVARDGSFAFPRRLPAGAAYAVEIATQPDARGCAVANARGIVPDGDVTSVAVTCEPLAALQRWDAATRWGARWDDADPALVEHAWFDATGLHETRGANAWRWAGPPGTEPAPRPFGGFPPLAGAADPTRYGGGPFGPGAALHYEATRDALALDGDMTVCAVLKPGYDPGASGDEKGIVAKGFTTATPTAPNPGGGWVLMQMHEQYCFHYHYTSAAAQAGAYCDPPSCYEMAYTPTELGKEGASDAGALDPSFVAVCAGRDGDTIRIAANSYPDTAYEQPAPPLYSVKQLFAGARLDVGATPPPATLGGYPTADPGHAFGGRLYEAAVWREAATPANLQAKLAAFQGLAQPGGGMARYARNREGPYVGGDGRLHTAWRHGPRLDPDRGMLFGLQGWNRLSTVSMGLDGYPRVTALGEALDLWQPSGGAQVIANQLAPPGDSERPSAERVRLPAGAALSVPMGRFDAPGAIHGQLWLRPVAGGVGVLTIAATHAQGGAESRQVVDLSSLPADAWTRVWLTALTTDGGPAPGALTLRNDGPAELDFYAWGVDVTQLGGGAELGAFDPGPAMYDWSASDDVTAQGTTRWPQDVLQLPPVPASTAPGGFCLAVDAAMPDGLAWTAPFGAARTALAWVADAPATSEARLLLEGGGGASAHELCFAVGDAGQAACAPVPGAWAPGSRHRLVGCMTAAGELRLAADDAPLAAAVTSAAVPDLAAGHLLVGNGSAAASPAATPWHGWISSAAACRETAIPAACR